MRTVPAPVSAEPPTPANSATHAGTEERRTPNAERRTFENPRTPENPQALLARLQSRWGELPRLALRDFQVALGTALTDSAPVALAESTLTIEMPGDFCRAHELDAALGEQLVALVERLGGVRLRILLRVRSSGAGDDRTRRYQAAAEHPLVKELLRRFEADILAREMISPEEWQGRIAGK